MITKLDVWIPSNISPINQFNLEKFCESFSNVEEFTCTISRQSVLLVLIMNLSKLTRINATISGRVSFAEMHYLQEDLQKSRIRILLDFDENKPSKITIWIIRNVD